MWRQSRHTCPADRALHPPLLPACSKVYQQLVGEGVITPAPEFKPPEVPMDLDYAKKTGKVGFVFVRWCSC